MQIDVDDGDNVDDDGRNPTTAPRIIFIDNVFEIEKKNLLTNARRRILPPPRSAKNDIQ